MKKISLAERYSWSLYAKVRLEIRDDVCQLGLRDRVRHRWLVSQKYSFDILGWPSDDGGT